MPITTLTPQHALLKNLYSHHFLSLPTTTTTLISPFLPQQNPIPISPLHALTMDHGALKKYEEIEPATTHGIAINTTTVEYEKNMNTGAAQMDGEILVVSGADWPMAEEHDCEINDSPIEEVRVSIPITDDNRQPTLTFRTWVLGILSCSLQASMVGFSRYRQNPIYIPPVCIQLVVLPIGKFMAATLPNKSLRIPGTKWAFSLNPGPFSMKEHALIFLLASQGENSPALLDMVTAIKVYYHKTVSFLPTLILSLSSNMMGYGFAGLTKRFLIDSPYMWWPQTVADVVMIQTLHEKESRKKGQLSKLQFFFIAFVCSFSYYIVPGYLFPSITTLSFICWIWKDSVTAQQIGAARNGLGLGSIAFDWNTMTPNPLVTPQFSLHCSMLGFILFFYIITLIAYWSNLYDAKRFPIFTSNIFDSDGQKFDVSQVLDPKTLRIDEKKYGRHSKVHLSVYYALAYGCWFAAISSSFTHVAIHYGRRIWNQLKVASIEQTGGDVHNRLMKKYAEIPRWWFYVLLITSVGLAIFMSSRYGDRVFYLPIWVVPVACTMGLIFSLINGIMMATTNQTVSFGIIPEIIMGYAFPGRPITNMLFKIYCTESMWAAIQFLMNFKYGHYMKIPPRSIFIVQVTGTLVSFIVDNRVTWYLLSTVKNICDTSKLPKGSPWTCPNYDVFNDITTIWGVFGPARVFAPYGVYGMMYLGFLVGIVATLLVCFLSHIYPQKVWIKQIYVPIIFTATLGMPPIRPVYYWSGWIAGVLYYLIVYRKYKGWWERYTYVLSNALDTGVAITGVAVYLALQMFDIYGVDWWGLDVDDHCPLAHCPTAPGIVVEGCPVFT